MMDTVCSGFDRMETIMDRGELTAHGVSRAYAN